VLRRSRCTLCQIFNFSLVARLVDGLDRDQEEGSIATPTQVERFGTASNASISSRLRKLDPFSYVAFTGHYQDPQKQGMRGLL
jgi:hypothetical protein